CSATAGVPVGETCNGIDDNCNGGADEGLSCTCYPTTEICDGRDNDCDSTVDEGFTTGTQCAVGTGICLRYGYNVCTANHLATQCNAVAGAPAAYEKCNNNLDDDCDGLTDEAGCLGSIQNGIVCPLRTVPFIAPLPLQPGELNAVGCSITHSSSRISPLRR
ncbi:hypothetical protein KBB06_03770, partial [Candidatus Gracilibacteria bacterium]|nr:hypothetical protein [Candidatus Gracilibacteria bacterium]